VAGTGLSLLATVFGCVAAFTYARWMGRSLIQHRFPGRIRKLDDFLRGHPFSMSLIIRLLPIGSNAVTNLLAGVSSVRGLPFFAGSALGYVPQNLVFALAGSGVNFDPTLRLTLATALFVISSLIGIWLYRKRHLGETLVDDPDQPVNDAPVREGKM
ncbi:MAG: VTT domain-containing protein, partial [Gammaproteobacteria bacterium]|nr:VTT domain-containing protein [Gammaproteobacteria bacterium]